MKETAHPIGISLTEPISNQNNIDSFPDFVEVFPPGVPGITIPRSNPAMNSADAENAGTHTAPSSAPVRKFMIPAGKMARRSSVQESLLSSRSLTQSPSFPSIDPFSKRLNIPDSFSYFRLHDTRPRRQRQALFALNQRSKEAKVQIEQEKVVVPSGG